ncbi:hypothetical protein JTB14_004917 [Gonioctena quinquepunctata]|nr:hypothetical protein JTB14_004917 [Gonioctena quinquepunctata]
MDWKRIENMDTDNLYDFLDTLSVDDEAAVFLEGGGDSDAEDGKILENLQKRFILRGPQLQKQGFAKLNLRMNRITILILTKFCYGKDKLGFY